MAITLPQTTGTLHPEYAATSISFNRNIQNINGVLTPVFTGNIAYERKDYLVDANGVKIGILSNDGHAGPAMDQSKSGQIWLDAEKLAALFSTAPASSKVIGEVIADMADEQIRLDLVSKGIITS
jgi:hypothetical protein